MPGLATAPRATPIRPWAAPVPVVAPRPRPGAAVAPIRQLAKGQALFSETDAATHVYRVLSGALRSARLLSDGRRQIDAFHLPGDILGLETGPEHRFGAEAVQDSVVAVHPRADFEGGCPTDPALSGQLVAALSRSLSRAQEHMLLLGCKSALERIASFLLGLSERLGTDHLRLPMTRADIADHLGLTIETVSRGLTQLERAGLIEAGADRRAIRLRDKAGLRRLGA